MHNWLDTFYVFRSQDLIKIDSGSHNVSIIEDESTFTLVTPSEDVKNFLMTYYTNNPSNNTHFFYL